MKFLFFLSFLLYTNLYSQEQKEYSPKVVEYMNILEEFRKELNYLPLPDEFYLTDEELENLLKKMYTAIEHDPEGYNNYLVRKYHECASDIKEKKIDEKKPSIGNIDGLIQKKIAEKYSQKFLTLITTPFFLRVKITDKSFSTYIDRNGNSHDQTVLKGKLEEILKGKKRFNEGDYISFMYLNKPTMCLRNYEIGNSYFIPFVMSTLEVSNYQGLSLQWYNCKGSYLIENEIIMIPDNYFEIAEEISWDEFKEKFIASYLVSD